MTSDSVLTIFRATRAMLEGHFRLSSGLHSNGYMQCALVLQDPARAAELGAALADAVRSLQPTVVLSPALGGIVIGHEVARGLGVRAIFAERVDAHLLLRRGFTLSASDRVLVVEDVVTTGKSTKETMHVAEQAGATVVGAGAIVDRSGGTSAVGVPFRALASINLPIWDPNACPLCAQQVPIVKPGSRPTPS